MILDHPDPAGIGPGLLGSEPAQHEGGVLERLALDQTGQQKVAFLPQPELVIQIDIGVVRQQPPGLELDQGGRDEKELGGHLEIEPFHAFELDQIGIDDVGQPDVVQLDLLAQDQVQEQVERALEHRGVNLIRHRDDHRPTRAG